ncbi:MAG: FMN-binding protein [Terrimesophilobacter sp.]
MRTRTAVTVAFASVSAVLIGWQFGATTLAPSATPSAAASSSAERTITGSSVDTPYGSVQVAITVSGKSISEVSAVHLTDQGGRSVQISNYAAPILRGEVLQSQTAKVNMVSGATYTSEAYLSSLQSALDQLGG